MRISQLRNPTVFGILAGLSFLAFLPSLFNGFVIDDNVIFLRNPHMNSWEGLYKIWFTTESVDYYPLTYTAFWVMKSLWGEIAFFYHLVNLALHVATAFIIFLILKKLDLPLAPLVAALFAIHPVQVETVAWASELKNLLSALFFFSAIYQFLHYLDEERMSRLLACLGFFLLAILSKATAVMLPPVLLMIYLWRRGNPLRAWPVFTLLFSISLGYGLFSTWIQDVHGAQGSDLVLTPGERVQIAGGAVWRYLANIFWPYPLSFNYPMWELNASSITHYLPAVAVLAAFALFLWKRTSWGGPPLLAFGFFAVVIFPALGFFDFYTLRTAYYADHYQYVAMLGPLILVGWILHRLIRFIPEPRMVPGALVLLFFPLGFLTWQETLHYEDKETLWRATLEVNPGSWMALNGLGGRMLAKNQPEEAEKLLRRAIAIRPQYLRARDNLAQILAGTDRVEEARAMWQGILAEHPDHFSANFHWARQLVHLGRSEESIEHFERALKVALVRTPQPHHWMGMAFEEMGKPDKAEEMYRKVLSAFPSFVRSHIALGDLADKRGDHAGAVEHYRDALRYHPFNAEYFLKIGNAQANQGKYAEAILYTKKAHKLARNSNLNDLAEESRLALEDYTRLEKGEM